MNIVEKVIYTVSDIFTPGVSWETFLPLLPVAIALIVYFLYANGLLVISSKRAVTFIGRPGSKCRKAQFTKLSGNIFTFYRFKQPKYFKFTLTSRLTEGYMEVRIKDKNRNVLLTLNPQKPVGTAVFKEKGRYGIEYAFKGASGQYELTVEDIHLASQADDE